MGVKDKVVDTTKGVAGKAKDTVTPDSSTSTASGQNMQYEEGYAGTDTGRCEDPLTEYRDKEAMTPAKIKEHEPTAVKRDPSDQKIVEPGQEAANPEEAREKARRSGMTKGTAGADETGSDYEQGAAGTNK